MPSSENKRIAKNTLFLYLRMLLVMVVALFTSRVVLAALGVENYGIYNVVGGISSSFIFFSSALSTSTQRYLNYELGKNNSLGVNRVFNINLLIYISLSIFILLGGFILGKWFVVHKLVIPEARVHDATIVLYATIISLASVFIFSVYESVLIARENMKLYAYLGIVDVIMKLGVAYLIMLIPDKLVYYAWLMLIVQVLPKLIMVIYCIKKYPEVKIAFYWNSRMFKEMFGFTGWNFYGSAIWMINTQGINVLLNMFFGPVVNAANGIAQQVNAAVTNFGNNFFTAVRPQLIKRFSAEEFSSFVSLIWSSSRFGIYLLWILSLPIILRAATILNLWLVDVPDFAPVFVQWVLLYSIANSLNNPVWTALMATGHIKKTVIIGSNLFLLAFPLGYISLKMGGASWSVFPMLIIGRMLFLWVAFRNLSKEIPQITLTDYFKNAIFPSVMVMIVSYASSMGINFLLPDNIGGLICFVIGSLVCSALIIFTIGITSSERDFIINLIKNKIGLRSGIN